jgi:hypothetical protein
MAFSGEVEEINSIRILNPRNTDNLDSALRSSDNDATIRSSINAAKKSFLHDKLQPSKEIIYR